MEPNVLRSLDVVTAAQLSLRQRCSDVALPPPIRCYSHSEAVNVDLDRISG